MWWESLPLHLSSVSWHGTNPLQFLQGCSTAFDLSIFLDRAIVIAFILHFICLLHPLGQGTMRILPNVICSIPIMPFWSLEKNYRVGSRTHWTCCEITPAKTPLISWPPETPFCGWLARYWDLTSWNQCQLRAWAQWTLKKAWFPQCTVTLAKAVRPFREGWKSH